MPLQRKATPGNRNLASSVFCFKSKGWYSYLTKKEQKILNDPSTVLATSFIPDDLVFGVSRSNIKNISGISICHILNTKMFRDGSMDSMEFQKKVQFFGHVHTSTRSIINEIPPAPSNVLNATSNQLREVPTIEYLKECVKKSMSGLKVPMNKVLYTDDWYGRFHELLRKCYMVHEFPPWALQSCYQQNETCGHLLQVNLSDVASNTLQLTMLETIDDSENVPAQTNVAALFI